ncbi:hypothetical protein BT96DRAFT_1010826, partial [Gymnopus androsaceus JB14]
GRGTVSEHENPCDTGEPSSIVSVPSGNFESSAFPTSDSRERSSVSHSNNCDDTFENIGLNDGARGTLDFALDDVDSVELRDLSNPLQEQQQSGGSVEVDRPSYLGFSTQPLRSENMDASQERGGEHSTYHQYTGLAEDRDLHPGDVTVQTEPLYSRYGNTLSDSDSEVEYAEVRGSDDVGAENVEGNGSMLEQTVIVPSDQEAGWDSWEPAQYDYDRDIGVKIIHPHSTANDELQDLETDKNAQNSFQRSFFSPDLLAHFAERASFLGEIRTGSDADHPSFTQPSPPEHSEINHDYSALAENRDLHPGDVTMQTEPLYSGNILSDSDSEADDAELRGSDEVDVDDSETDFGQSANVCSGQEARGGSSPLQGSTVGVEDDSEEEE